VSWITALVMLVVATGHLAEACGHAASAASAQRITGGY
jgi:hypothetical protein